MIQLIFIFLGMTIAILFTRMTHPLAMGLTLLAQTLVIALTTGLMTSSFWFSYILFLVFMGGMLVLFIYVTSLASNEMFSISSQALMISLTTVSLIFVVSFINDPLVWLNPLMTDQLTSLDFLPTIETYPSLMIKLYNTPTSYLTLLLVIYLFLTLVAVVSITNIFEGPLRSKY